MGSIDTMNVAPMDTTGQKTPVPLPFAAWQAMTASEAAHEVHARIASLPEALRNAALAWLRPERELTEELARHETAGKALCPDSIDADAVPSGHKARLPTVKPGIAITLAPTNSLHPLRGVPYLLKDLFDAA